MIGCDLAEVRHGGEQRTGFPDLTIPCKAAFFTYFSHVEHLSGIPGWEKGGELREAFNELLARLDFSDQVELKFVTWTRVSFASQVRQALQQLRRHPGWGTVVVSLVVVVPAQKQFSQWLKELKATGGRERNWAEVLADLSVAEDVFKKIGTNLDIRLVVVYMASNVESVTREKHPRVPPESVLWEEVQGQVSS